MKKPPHDFLSLSTSFQHNTDARSAQGYPAFPMTHDFLQPLGMVRNRTPGPKGTSETLEKEATKQHVLPSGISAYSVGHMGPEFRKRSSGRKTAEGTIPETPKLATDNGKAPGSTTHLGSCAGFYGNGAFTLWQEMGGGGGDKRVERSSMIEPVEKATGAYGSAEKVIKGVDPKMSSLFARSNFAHTMTEAVQRPSQCEEQHKLGFVEMTRSVKVSSEDEDEEEECADRSGDTKRESSSQRGDAAVRSDCKSSNQRANTPRSKHSATEQRRRSKINDRFQILREIVPHSDQKRDKASFLLEVIEYIQSLQEKIHKYETYYPEWDEEKMKTMSCNNKNGLTESDTDCLRAQNNAPPLLFGSKFDEGGTYGTSSIVTKSPNLTMNILTSLMENKLAPGPSGYPNKTVGSVSLPISPSISPPVRNILAHQHQRLLSGPENVLTLSQSQSQSWSRSCLTVQPLRRDASQLAGNEHQELVIEDGLISVSSVYSRELLGTLTQALQSSGVDLSQANVSVQINLGRRDRIRPSTTTSSAKDHEEPPSTSNHILMHSRPHSGSGGDSENARKRPKPEKDL